MQRVTRCDLPERALLRRYLRDGTYTDCFATVIPEPVTQARYVTAFYTTPVFKLERWVLHRLFSLPSSDAQAAALADGSLDAFAAWRVEAREADQLLLCDLPGRTRSWLMVVPTTIADVPETRLYFGSAIVAVEDPDTGELRLGAGYRSLLGFHKLYSRVLLHAARSRLAANRA